MFRTHPKRSPKCPRNCEKKYNDSCRRTVLVIFGAERCRFSEEKKPCKEPKCWMRGKRPSKNNNYHNSTLSSRGRRTVSTVQIQGENIRWLGSFPTIIASTSNLESCFQASPSAPQRPPSAKLSAIQPPLRPPRRPPPPPWAAGAASTGRRRRYWPCSAWASWRWWRSAGRSSTGGTRCCTGGSGRYKMCFFPSSNFLQE